MRVVTSAVVLLALVFGVQVASAQGNDVNNASPVKVLNVEPLPRKTTASRSISIRTQIALEYRNKIKFMLTHKVKPKVIAIDGILPSAYVGPYYDARYEAYRRCVVKRESEGKYYVVERNSGAAGAYQFMPAWTHTIQQWTGHYVLIRKMTRYEQDYAFWRVFNHGKGARNWAGGRWYCGF